MHRQQVKPMSTAAAAPVAATAAPTYMPQQGIMSQIATTAAGVAAVLHLISYV